MVTKDNLTIKIIDFGSCKDETGTKFEEELKKKKQEMQKKSKRKTQPEFENYVGTPNFMAPECVHNKETSRKSDCFSLGCLLYQLYFGFPPFTGKSEYIIYLKSTECKYSIPDGLIDDEGKNLIQNLLVISQKKRLSIEEILNHSYFNISEKEIEGSNNYNSILSFEKESLFQKSDENTLDILLSYLNYNDNQAIYNNLYTKTKNSMGFSCNEIEIKFKVMQDEIREKYSKAKEYISTLEELKRNIDLTQENQQTVKEDSFDKLGLIVIHLTNYETNFKYCFKYIKEKIKELEINNYLKLRIEQLEKQLLYELFNEDFNNKDDHKFFKDVNKDDKNSNSRKSSKSKNSKDSDKSNK